MVFMLIRLLLLAALLLPLASCDKKEARAIEKPTVLVSVPPYVYFVNKIARGLVDVETLVPAGANPHIYEATPREVLRYQNAALWVYLGEPLDKKVLEYFRNSQRQIRILDVAQKIDLLSEGGDRHCCEHDHVEGDDLHIWLSPVLAKQQAARIAESL